MWEVLTLKNSAMLRVQREGYVCICVRSLHLHTLYNQVTLEELGTTLWGSA